MFVCSNSGDWLGVGGFRSNAFSYYTRGRRVDVNGAAGKFAVRLETSLPFSIVQKPGFLFVVLAAIRNELDF